MDKTFLNVLKRFGSLHCDTNANMKATDIESRVAALVGDVEGPLGRVPLERVLRQHLCLFQELRATGASWPQIATLMRKKGLTRKDGKAIAPEQWAAMISRIAKRDSYISRYPNSNVAPASADKTSVPQSTVQTEHEVKAKAPAVGKYADVRNRMVNARKARDDA